MHEKALMRLSVFLWAHSTYGPHKKAMVYWEYMKIHLATDHAGFNMKEHIKSWLHNDGYDIVDHGAFAFDQDDDYPDFIAEAARAVQESPEDCALVFGGSGQGEAMVANRFSGIRATVYYGTAGKQSDADGVALDIIEASKMHNHANVLSLGARFISNDEAERVIKQWLGTSFTNEERHVRRIAAIERVSNM